MSFKPLKECDNCNRETEAYEGVGVVICNYCIFEMRERKRPTCSLCQLKCDEYVWIMKYSGSGNGNYVCDDCRKRVIKAELMKFDQ